MRKHRGILTVLAAAVWLSATAPASAQSIEDKLRTQLRSTAEQLRSLQDTQSQLQADKTAAEQQRDKALADLKQAQADLAASKGKSDTELAAERALATEKSSHAQDTQQLAKYRSAYEDLMASSRSHDMERTQAQAALKTSDAQLQRCEAKNIALYQVGHDILDAYEHVGLGSFLSSREPFAQGARVRYDQIAQNYGDTLYSNKFDPRAGSAGAGVSAAPAAPAASK